MGYEIAAMHSFLMGQAYKESFHSTCIRREVGCVIARDGKIIGRGHNKPPKGISCGKDGSNCYRTKYNIPSGQQLDKCNALHAEEYAILDVLHQNKELKGTTLYVTHFPCLHCAKLIIKEGIKNVYFAEDYNSNETIEILRTAGVTVTQYKIFKF